MSRKAPSPESDQPKIRVSCPICGRRMEGRSLTEWPVFPFCSPRCKTIDLGRWLGETYRLPAEEPEEPISSEEPELP
ncbi:MAG TPA: DNA gyrase inhibitor YacG [Gemmataceae bacterium]|nr:DNA gyrase inhibitor YacG [Gemmataceae bacterium]